MENDRLTFWRNWYVAARHLPDDIRLSWYDAVLDFAFEGKDPEMPCGAEARVADAVAFQAVAMVRATIEISRKRKEFGSKGGSKRKANRKQKPSKAQAKAKQVQEQVQEQEQEHNANSITATARGKTPTVSVFVEAGKLAGVADESWLRDLHRELVEAGWADKDGRRIGNWRRYLKTAWVDFQKKISARASAVDALDSIRDAR